MRILVIIGLISVSHIVYGFTGASLPYGNAITYAQKEDWPAAHDALKKLVNNYPDRPDIIYDTGVAAHRMQDYQKARAYFKDAAQNAAASLSLQEQALFNAGNAAVALKDLDDAINLYQKVLTINPDNERAKHNLAIVKKMKEEQQNQSKEDQQNKDDKQDNNNNNDPSDSQNQQSNQQSNKQSDNNQDQKNNDSQKKSGNDNQRDKDNQSMKNDSTKDESSESDQQQNNNDQANDQKDASQNQKNTENAQANDQKKDNAGKQQSEKQQSQESSDQKASQKKDEAASHSAVADQKEKQEVLPVHDTEEKDATKKLTKEQQWMVQLLDAQEKQDEQANKQQIKAVVNKKLAGQRGQNLW